MNNVRKQELILAIEKLAGSISKNRALRIGGEEGSKLLRKLTLKQENAQFSREVQQAFRRNNPSKTIIGRKF